MGVFVWPLALATTSKGGDAGEKRPVESSRWRLAVCSDMNTALWGDGACRRKLLGARSGLAEGGEVLVMSAWRLPRGSTAAERVGGALDDAHAKTTAVLAGILRRAERCWGERDGVRGVVTAGE
jgi:hypothetical protein